VDFFPISFVQNNPRPPQTPDPRPQSLAASGTISFNVTDQFSLFAMFLLKSQAVMACFRLPTSKIEWSYRHLLTPTYSVLPWNGFDLRDGYDQSCAARKRPVLSSRRLMTRDDNRIMSNPASKGGSRIDFCCPAGVRLRWIAPSLLLYTTKSVEGEKSSLRL
jgi:hypothetical protein